MRWQLLHLRCRGRNQEHRSCWQGCQYRRFQYDLRLPEGHHGEQYVISDDVDSSPKAVKAKGNLTITGGTVLVSALGGEGSEGLESKNILTITGGEVLVNCYDDCLNASSHIQIDGGDVYCYSTGNDAIDSNGTLSITGGTVVAIGTMVPESGFDCDENTFAISGGTVLGIGGTTSNPTASACSQASVIYSGQLSKGTLFSIVSSDASHVMSYTIPCAYNQTTILFSSASLAQGSSYTIYTGGSVSGGSEFYGLVTVPTTLLAHPPTPSRPPAS